MNTLSLFILSWCLLLAALEVWLSLRLLAAYRPAKIPAADSGFYPRAMAVLCLRGSDTSLRECLRRLASQDYPDYHLRIVLDSERDPASSDVQAFLESNPRISVDVQYLERRLPHCSGKVSSILQATEGLSPDIQVVAIFDADVLLHASCLRELVAPLADSRVGVTFGNRWYAAGTAALAPLVRSSWNSYALAVMNIFGILWGGCMALRAVHVRDREYRAAQARSFTEEAPTLAFMRQRGLTHRFVAEATILNTEGITLKGLYNFLVRQHLTTRIGHPQWALIFLHNLLLTGSLTAAVVVPWLPGMRPSASVGCAVLLAVGLVHPLLARRRVARSLARRNATLTPLTVRQWLVIPFCALATAAATFVVNLHAALARRHLWRGVTYSFGGRPPVKVVHVAEVAGALSAARVLAAAAQGTGAGAAAASELAPSVPAPYALGQLGQTHNLNDAGSERAHAASTSGMDVTRM